MLGLRYLPISSLKRLPIPRLVSHRTLTTDHFCRRKYATVSPSIVGQPPHPPESTREEFSEAVSRLLDCRIVQTASLGHQTSLPEIIRQYIETSGAIVDVSLPYEDRPSEARRANVSNPTESCKNVFTVAHCTQVGSEHKITLSSGFALNVQSQKPEGETLIITCAHTLEEIRQSPLLLSGMNVSESSEKHSGTFVVTGSGQSVQVYPVSTVVSALPRSDLILLSCKLPAGSVNTLPVSPYPSQKDTPILAHFVSTHRPDDPGWTRWIGDTWGKWHRGTVLGYRDFAGRETEPGTYDALSHLFFTPLPTAGSSGGPIIEEESGAVIGVMLGTRMENHVEGVRGWGVPAETIFEMFTLPGLEGKK
ncbi:hypothetical protein CPB84DRAFT_1273220 [Gymnopilus junonius]|uniref:Uncharacterized protein n=1 Tax=Gymnopilus junonius TaxID=109634 RepID=A0A9P5NN38_GYMJU|nr:hypothetical protein CPB84DRAFT_1273220 [Gymnopilus junonius]